MVIHVGFGIAHGSPILNQAVEFQLFGQLLGYEILPQLQVSYTYNRDRFSIDMLDMLLVTVASFFLATRLMTDEINGSDAIDGVIVTTPVPDGRVKLGAQVVQLLVEHGFLGDPWMPKKKVKTTSFFFEIKKWPYSSKSWLLKRKPDVFLVKVCVYAWRFMQLFL